VRQTKWGKQRFSAPSPKSGISASSCAEAVLEGRLVALLAPRVEQSYWKRYQHTLLEQLQQFGKSIWHPSNFGKTRKIGL
jgi:hypothetical protein